MGLDGIIFQSVCLADTFNESEVFALLHFRAEFYMYIEPHEEIHVVQRSISPQKNAKGADVEVI